MSNLGVVLGTPPTAGVRSGIQKNNLSYQNVVKALFGKRKDEGQEMMNLWCLSGYEVILSYIKTELLFVMR